MSRFTAVGMTAVSLVLAIASTACGHHSEADAAADALRQLVDRPAVLDEAEKRLTAQCMAHAGMTYPQVPVQHDDRPMVGLLRDTVPLRAETARRNGYPDAWMTRDRIPKEGPVDSYADSLPADARERFYRSLRGEGGNNVRVVLPGNLKVAASSSGCVGSARQQLYGSVANYLTVFYLPEVVKREASSADEDSDVRVAYTAFARCMTAKGYHAATPAQAVALARTYYPRGLRKQTGPEEKTLALADARCQTTVRLRQRHAAAADRIARSWLAENKAAVSKAHRLLQSALAEAKTAMNR